MITFGKSQKKENKPLISFNPGIKSLDITPKSQAKESVAAPKITFKSLQPQAPVRMPTAPTPVPAIKPPTPMPKITFNPQATSIPKKGKRVTFNVPKEEMPPLKEVIKAVPESFSKVVGQPQLRAYGAVGSYIAKKLGLAKEDLTPSDPFSKELFGTDKPINLTKVGRETRGADPEGDSSGVLKFIDPTIGLLVGSLDALDGGAAGKILRLTKNGKQLIARSKDAAEIKTVLKREIPSISDELADVISRPLVYVDNVDEVESILNSTKYEIQELAKRRAPQQQGTITFKPKQAVSELPEAAPRIAAVAEEAPAVSQVSKELAPLAEEAKKYKSVEEFASDISKREFRYEDNVKPTATVGEIPIARFDGKDIVASQNTVDRKGVDEWKKRIEAGERPRVLVEFSERYKEPRIIDGHTRLNAYKELGVENIPAIDNTGSIIKNGVALKDIYNQTVNSAPQKVDKKPLITFDLSKARGKISAYEGSQYRRSGELYGGNPRGDRGGSENRSERVVDVRDGDRPGPYIQSDIRSDAQRSSANDARTLPIEQKIELIRSARIDQVDYSAGRIDKSQFIEKSVERAKAFGLPPVSTAVLEKNLQSMPDEVLKNFGGIDYVPRMNADISRGGFSVQSSDSTVWSLLVNPKFYDLPKYKTGAIIRHEITGHASYAFLDSTRRKQIASEIDAVIDDGKGEEILGEIFTKDSTDDFQASTLHYYLEDIARAQSIVADFVGGDYEIVRKIFKGAGIFKENGSVILANSGSEYFVKMRNTWGDVEAEIRGNFRDKWDAKRWAELERPRSFSFLSNEVYARYIEKGPILSKNVQNAFKGTYIQDVALKAISDLPGTYKNTVVPDGSYSISDEAPDGFRADRLETEKGLREMDKIARREALQNPPITETGKKVIELTQVRDDLKHTLESNPARGLIKYVSPVTGRLPEVTGKETKRALTGSGAETPNSIFGRRGDDIVTELGFKDVDDAQRGIDEYLDTRKRFRDTTKELVQARRDLFKERLAEKDKRSAAVLLNKKQTPAEEAIARRDKIVKQEKDLASKREAMNKQIEETQVRMAAYAEKVQRAQRSVQQSKGFWRKVKEALYPVKGVDKETKGLFEDWIGKKLLARETANELEKQMAKMGPQNMEEIIAYESGKPTRYIREAFDSMGNEAKSHGLEFTFRDDYVPHVYKQDRGEVMEAIAKYLKQEKKMSDAEIEDYLSGGELPKDKSLRLKLVPNFVKERIFPSYSVAIKYGLTPKYRTPAKLIAHYQEELDLAIANKNFIKQLKAEAKLLEHGQQPDHWVAVSPQFSKETLYAAPELANLINGKFRDESNLGLFETIVKGLGATSRFMQTIALSAGVPFTNINYFSIGQAVRILTTAIGEASSANFKSALSSLKSSFAFIRANSNAWSAKWFYDNRAYITRMAMEGIDVSGRVGNFKYEGLWKRTKDAFEEMVNSGTLWGKTKAFGKMPAALFDKMFNEKTFGSMMAQVSVQTFKDTYELARSKGMDDAAAGKFAADVTRNFTGQGADSGRSIATEDTLSTVFFAPKFREGIINIFANAAQSISPKNFRNPALAKSRGLLIGAVLTYGLYQYLNQKINGNYTWENPPGREFAIRIPLPNGQVAYIEFLPSTLAFMRNMASGTIALGKGDFETATQKYGTIFSMPIKLFTEVYANKDYFGREIYSDGDTGPEKLKKIGMYGFLSVNHPYIKELYYYSEGKQPLYQTLSIMLEMPVKYSTLDKEDKAVYYEALEKQQKKRADMKDKVRPIYERNQQLKAEGKNEEADEIYWNLSDDDRALYNQIKKDEKTKATNARKPFVKKIYDTNQELKAQGRIEEADEIYWGLSPEDRKIYQSIKRSAESVDGL